MSTHCSIRIRRTDGSMTGIYCQYDGYIEAAGVVLRLCYNTAEKVEELLKLGDLSTIGEYTDGANRDICEAYHRDRGEEFCQTISDEEYIYTYDVARAVWYVTKEIAVRDSTAIDLLGLNTQFYKTESLLLDEIIHASDAIRKTWRTDEFAEPATVIETCIQKAVEAREDIVRRARAEYESMAKAWF